MYIYVHISVISPEHQEGPDLGRAFIHYLVRERALTQTTAGKGGAGGSVQAGQRVWAERTFL